jgi:hypothetical protein
VLRFMAVLAIATAARVRADVFSYEADSMPDSAGWTLEQLFCDPALSVEGGWFRAHLDLCPGYPPSIGREAVYRRYLAEFIGTPAFWAEWRVQTDSPRDFIPFGAGASIGIGGVTGINYTFDIASDQAKLNRDNFLPIIFVSIEAEVPHVFRLELYGAQRYVWYIDSRIVDSGLPQGTFPADEQDSIVWLSRSRYVPNDTRWDYFRYGDLIPAQPADVNCDGLVNNFDIDPFVLALSDLVAYGAQYPACSRLAGDANGDGHIDNFDIDPFVLCLIDGCQ